MTKRPNFAMFTPAGDRAAQHIFDTLKERLKADVKLLNYLYDDLKKAHPETSDTAVRECMGYALFDLLYEALEYFGEGVMIEGEAFRRFFVEKATENVNA